MNNGNIWLSFLNVGFPGQPGSKGEKGPSGLPGQPGLTVGDEKHFYS